MAVRDMVARHSDYIKTKDFIPTPGYATRVLYEEVAPEIKLDADQRSVLDPACGNGHMLSVFEEYGYKEIVGSDIIDSPDRKTTNRFVIEDFTHPSNQTKYDDIITNPPYKPLQGFINMGLHRANQYFALLVRVQALETQGRFPIFRDTPPTRIAFFSDRIPFKSGVTIRKASKMFFHVWLFWDIQRMKSVRYKPDAPVWITPTAQEKYERMEDYDAN